MRVGVFSNIFSLGTLMVFSIGALSGLNSWPGCAVTTAMPVVASRKTAAPLCSPNGDHSGGTAILQIALASCMTIQPGGRVCADTGSQHKRTRTETTHSLMGRV